MRITLQDKFSENTDGLSKLLMQNKKIWKKNVKLGVALVGMRHLNYRIYSKNNKIYPPPLSNKILIFAPGIF